jgi:radical SAM protein with 4Fe4S-binding SPASM domain
MYLTKKVLSMLRRYCGAVAVSMENIGEKLALWRIAGFAKITHAIATLIASSIRTVIQVTLAAENFSDIDDIADFCISRKRLYGVIFLAYKPVGRGLVFSRPLSTLDPLFVSGKLQSVFRKLSPHMRVGYDCCLSPAIAAHDRNGGFVAANYIEGCSALRGSLGLSPGLDVVPCTFLQQRVLGNLKRDSLTDIWNGIKAREFRDSVEKKIIESAPCDGCAIKNTCLGGCPVMELAKCSRMGTGGEGKNRCT